MTNTSSPIHHSLSETDMDGTEISQELEQLGVDLVDQNDLEKTLMAKVKNKKRKTFESIDF